MWHFHKTCIYVYTQFPALAGPPQRELLAWILVQLMFFSAACLVVQFLGGPALFFSACLLGGPLGGGPALLFFHLNGGPVWAWSRYFSVGLLSSFLRFLHRSRLWIKKLSFNYSQRESTKPNPAHGQIIFTCLYFSIGVGLGEWFEDSYR